MANIFKASGMWFQNWVHRLQRVDDVGHGRNYSRMFENYARETGRLLRLAKLKRSRRGIDFDAAAGLTHELIRGLDLAHAANLADATERGIVLRRVSNADVPLNSASILTTPLISKDRWQAMPLATTASQKIPRII